jgi:hypothetical protein
MLLRKHNKCPILFIEVKPPSHLQFDSKRYMADKQMRQCSLNLHSVIATPRLYGIGPAADPSIHNNVAPVDWWNDDLHDHKCFARIHDIIEDVVAMCDALDN